MNNSLIVLEQLPVIKYKLEQLSIEIKEKLNKINGLIVNEDTVKETKQLRAELNKEFNELEMQRKTVKQAIMSKYDEFEVIYKDCVSNLYKNADAELKEKIDNVENQLKQEKEDTLRQFFENYREDAHLEEIINFEDVGLNITLSASEKSLKEQIVEFVKKVSDDFQAISSCENREEILLEYKKNGFNYSQAVNTINTKKDAIKSLQEKLEQTKQIQNDEQEVVKTVDTLVSKPIEVIDSVPPQTITCTFTIVTTLDKITKLKDFLKKEGIDYQ